VRLLASVGARIFDFVPRARSEVPVIGVTVGVSAAPAALSIVIVVQPVFFSRGAAAVAVERRVAPLLSRCAR